MKRWVLFVFVFMFALSPGIAGAAESELTLTVSAQELLRGGELTLSGTVARETEEIVLKIVRPDRTVFYLDVIAPADGKYSAAVSIPASPDLAPYGVYRIVAGDGATTAVQSFSVVGRIGGSGSDSGGGTGAGAGQRDLAGIPQAAGTLENGTVQPELAEDGRYVAGSGTLSVAAREAVSQITFELPESAAQTGAVLEFPSQSAREFDERQLDIVLVSGPVTVRLPARSLMLSDDEQSRVRVSLHTAMTDEAKRAIEDAVRSNPSYRATGIVLSVTIEEAAGDGSMDIGQLKRAATVTIRLTAEQQAAIAAGLAGVYYLDGEQTKYVGGIVAEGQFTFTAEHFSYYALLEYDKQFSDLAGHWSDQAVKRLAAKHIVSGVDDLHYEPDRSITRAEFVALVMRALAWTGFEAEPAESRSFTDVPPNQYYSIPTEEAAGLGIVSGHHGAFRPNDTMTREEAVSAIVRAAPYFGMPSSVNGAPPFADRAEISAWAKDAVDEAWSLGLIRGDGVKFYPKNPLSRAEVAVILEQLLSGVTRL